MRLVDIYEYPVTLTLVTGLKIGAADTGMKIGGTDVAVVTHPYTNEPYVPGSSLKGKLRALQELSSGVVQYTQGEVLNLKHVEKITEPAIKDAARAILTFFGVSAADQVSDTANMALGLTRLGVADAFIKDGYRKYLIDQQLPFKETKSENSIDRKTGIAKHPRTIERVPAGVEFAVKFTIKIFENDDLSQLERVLFRGCRLIELDYLGGNGTRGYGRVRFTFDEQQQQDRYQKVMAFE